MFDKNKGRQRIDGGIPLGIMIHSMLKIVTGKFLLNGDKLLVKPAVDGYYTVRAIGKFRAFGADKYRVYIDDASGGSAMLQISMGGETPDIVFYTVYDEITSPIWDAWLDEGTGLIGGGVFKIQDDKLGEVLFERVLGAHEDYIPSVEFDELVIDDPYGDSGYRINTRGMIYSRTVGNIDEYCFVAAERNNSTAGVLIYTGIDLDTSELDILGA
jgi:hypothetical protein